MSPARRGKKPPARRPLTPKQERFAQLYVELGNASEAYREVFEGSRRWAPKSVHERASHLLATAKVAARVAVLTEAAGRQHAVSAERIIGELAAVAFADLADFVSIDETGRVTLDFEAASKKDSLRALAEVSQDEYWDGRGEDAREVKRTKFKLADKIRALELLGKRFRLWVDKVEHGGTVGVTKVPELTRDEARILEEEFQAAMR